MGKLIPITRDQEFMAEMLAELKGIRQLLVGLKQVDKGEFTCTVCGRSFLNARGLRAHMRVHREDR